MVNWWMALQQRGQPSTGRNKKRLSRQCKKREPSEMRSGTRKERKAKREQQTAADSIDNSLPHSLTRLAFACVCVCVSLFSGVTV